MKAPWSMPPNGTAKSHPLAIPSRLVITDSSGATIHAGDDAGRDHVAHGIDGHDRERVDLSAHLHRSDARRNRGAGLRRDHDRRERRAVLAEDRRAQKGAEHALGPEQLEDVNALQGDDRADRGHPRGSPG